MMPIAPMGSSMWSTGFCDCCGPPGGCVLCCKAFWCPCVIYGELAERLRGSEAMFGGDNRNACLMYCGADFLPPIIGCPSLGFLLHCQARQSVRTRYGITEEPCCDCLAAFCCSTCSFVQIHKELSLRNTPAVVNGMAVPMQPYAPVAYAQPVMAQPVNEMK
mmetsp:Transcript_4563/g.11480  ORF Transcript_4563/g.11480 Transcript_4563/m.11480 type:complete len:162 (-) Transcript_4563:83-568(-)|eukprot:CAMPEP_0206267998 /NCGR_PEP_ID=MMETSP0047_2-20121206/31461_1 /ASSEMBLY_ACC=CAM_ASM_000192 /TAXON_ID=195065 /ORGANISM="Chroomonas mesostigmatica_cf, Strain CCMP1168" /LENGTH=161 /DNA_ID=CAMNT_0053696265 /DNA_START=62 /DNA_END=547 /DNA_ORIENTATION=+